MLTVTAGGFSTDQINMFRNRNYISQGEMKRRNSDGIKNQKKGIKQFKKPKQV